MIQVYSYRRCPFAIRVRMTLHEKGIPFHVIEEDLKNMSSELKKLHPEAKVPLLVHDGTVVYESAIITEYLDDVFRDPPLMPKDAGERKDARLWTYWCNHIFKPEIDRVKYGEKKLSPEEMADSRKKLEGYLAKLDRHLSRQDWLVGDKITLADIHVFPFFRQVTKIMPAFEPVQKYKKALEWLERITNRPSFEKTMAKKK